MRLSEIGVQVVSDAQETPEYREKGVQKTLELPPLFGKITGLQKFAELVV